MQTLKGMSRLGSPLMRRGQAELLDEALDGIERALAMRPARRTASDFPSPGGESDAVPPGGTRSGGGGGTPRSSRSSTPRRSACCGSGSGSWSRGRWRASLEEFDAAGARAAAAGAGRGGGGGERLRGDEDRLRHAAGRGYVDLARLRNGAPGGRTRRGADARRRRGAAAGDRGLRRARASRSSPSAAAPASSAASSRCAAATSALISLDLGALREVEVDRRSLTARLGAGLRGPEAEAALGREGLTLGHFPQSFEYATIGGFAATRSAGQASSGYGRFDALVSSVRLLAPAGEISTLETPHTAAGPALRELVIGSEGVLGVIPDVTVRVRPAPAVRRYEAWMAESFEAGAEIVRALAQGPGLPEIIRVSDEEETEGTLALTGPRGLSGAALRRLPRRCARRRGGALMIVGFEGDEESVARRRALTVRALRARRRRLPRPGAPGAPGSTAATRAPTCATR